MAHEKSRDALSDCIAKLDSGTYSKAFSGVLRWQRRTHAQKRVHGGLP